MQKKISGEPNMGILNTDRVEIKTVWTVSVQMAPFSKAVCVREIDSLCCGGTRSQWR